MALLKTCLAAGSLALLAALTVFPAALQAQQVVFTSPIVGTWITETGSQITVEPCPVGFCGYVTKIVVPQRLIDQYGEDVVNQFQPEEFTDRFNADPSLRDRPILGLQILALTHQTGPVRYDGKVYNPEDGQIYDGFVEILGPDRVRMSGCGLFNTICRGEDWNRAPVVETAEAEIDAGAE